MLEVTNKTKNFEFLRIETKNIEFHPSLFIKFKDKVDNDEVHILGKQGTVQAFEMRIVDDLHDQLPVIFRNSQKILIDIESDYLVLYFKTLDKILVYKYTL